MVAIITINIINNVIDFCIFKASNKSQIRRWQEGQWIERLGGSVG